MYISICLYIYIYICVYVYIYMYVCECVCLCKMGWWCVCMAVSCMCHDVCVMTYPFACHDSSMCVSWLIHVRVMTHSYVSHDSYMRVSYLIHACVMTHSRVYYDMKIGRYFVSVQFRWYRSWRLHDHMEHYWDRVRHNKMIDSWWCLIDKEFVLFGW